MQNWTMFPKVDDATLFLGSCVLLFWGTMALADPPYGSGRPGEIAPPLPLIGITQELPPDYSKPFQILGGPMFAQDPQPRTLPPVQLAANDTPLPINLATALCLSNARSLIIADAQASVEEALALLQGPKSCGCPTSTWAPTITATTEWTNRPTAR